MKAKIQYIVFFISILLVPSGLRSEITSQTGQYVGSNLSSEGGVYAEVSQDGSVVLYLFSLEEEGGYDIFNFELSEGNTAVSRRGLVGEFTLGAPSSTRRATFKLDSGETYTLNYSPPGTGDQTGYVGSFAEPSGGGGINYAVEMIMLADDRVIWMLSGLAWAVGVLDSQGVEADLVVSGDSIIPLTFTFQPENGHVRTPVELEGYQYIMELWRVNKATLTNISTRGWIGGGKNMISGTVVDGDAKRLLIRAVGPALSDYGVSTAHPNPRITLVEGQEELASNDDWAGSDIADIAAYVGAFPLSEGSKDACLLVTVAGGVYTIIAEGDGDLGEVLVEVYEVP